MPLEEEENRGLGAFRVLRRLPASSREVLLAKDAEGKQVVLKVFDAPERNQGLFDDKVADEASAYGRLSHPNIVKVVDIFSADGKFVIALEWVDGSSLAVVRAMLERDQKKVPDECWLYVMHSVFAALAEAHAAKGADGKPAPVLHRGVNPSNVLIAWDGQVKLGNFNVAQSVRVLRDSNPGLTWGSYGYFAPEQVKLQPTTTATDVFSAALMLYELLAGKKALARGEMTDTDLLKAMASPKFTPLEQLRRDIAPPVRYAVRAGLEPDPKRRIASAVRIRDVLRAAIDLDAARAKLVEILAGIRQHEASTVAPPAFDLDEPLSAEMISVAPDPPSVPPPAVSPPPPPPVPAVAAHTAAPPAAPPTPPPARTPTPPAPAIASSPAPALAPTTAPLPFAPVAPPQPALPPATPAASEPPVAIAPAQPVSTPVTLELAVPPEPPLPVVPISTRARRKRPIAAVVIGVLGLAAAIVVVAGGLVMLRAKKTQAAPTPTQTIAIAPTPTPTQTQAPTPTPTQAPTQTQTPATETAAASATATTTTTTTATPTATTTTGTTSSTRGTLNLPAAAAGHRVFVDGHVVSDGAGSVEIACGHHNVRIGSHGRTQSIDVPCGGALDLQP